MRRKAKHWTLQLSPAIHPTPIPCPKNTLMGTFENWKKIFLSYCHQLSPLPHPPPKFALDRSFCVTIFQSIAMFSCQFAKVAILDHYSWSEGSGDEIAEYFKVCALAHALTTSLAHEFKNVSIDSIVLHKVSVRFTPDPCGKEEKALFLFNIFTFIPFPLIPSLPSRPSFPWVWKK